MKPNTNKITFRKAEKKDKKDIYGLFHADKKSGVHIENSSFAMLGLETMNEDQLIERMIKCETEVVFRNKQEFLGIIEIVPYSDDALELRSANYIFGNIDPVDSEAATQEYIIGALKIHGAKRIILEVSKENNIMITHLLGAGYRVISTINNTITFEFDFSKFNQK